MTDANGHRVLWIWTAGELLLLAALGGILWRSLVGDPGVLASVPRTVRLGGLAFVVIELLIPAWVFVDLRRRVPDPDYMWVHVAAMPLLNIVGLLAYLVERQRRAV